MTSLRNVGPNDVLRNTLITRALEDKGAIFRAHEASTPWGPLQKKTHNFEKAPLASAQHIAFWLRSSEPGFPILSRGLHDVLGTTYTPFQRGQKNVDPNLTAAKSNSTVGQHVSITIYIYMYMYMYKHALDISGTRRSRDQLPDQPNI